VGALIAFRTLQAVGGGGMLPLAFGIVTDQFYAQRAIELFTSVGPLDSIVGPNLGGYVHEHWTSRDLFFINVPIGLVAFVVLAFSSTTGNLRLGASIWTRSVWACTRAPSDY
jgi:MFS family permease